MYESLNVNKVDIIMCIEAGFTEDQNHVIGVHCATIRFIAIERYCRTVLERPKLHQLRPTEEGTKEYKVSLYNGDVLNLES
jgi:hypothetical protein